MLCSPDQEDRRAERLETIVQAAERARDLTRQLLAFGRRQALEVCPLDLNSIVGEMQNLLRRALRENVQLRIVLAPEPCIVMADAVQVEQIVMNLAVNGQDSIFPRYAGCRGWHGGDWAKHGGRGRAGRFWREGRRFRGASGMGTPPPSVGGTRVAPA